jgi:hypothetical protein
VADCGERDNKGLLDRDHGNYYEIETVFTTSRRPSLQPLRPFCVVIRGRKMNSLRQLVKPRVLQLRRSLASETKKPFESPPYAPNTKRQEVISKTILVLGISVFAFIFLKPWDYESVLDTPEGGRIHRRKGEAAPSAAP